MWNLGMQREAIIHWRFSLRYWRYPWYSIDLFFLFSDRNDIHYRFLLSRYTSAKHFALKLMVLITYDKRKHETTDDTKPAHKVTKAKGKEMKAMNLETAFQNRKEQLERTVRFFQSSAIDTYVSMYEQNPWGSRSRALDRHHIKQREIETVVINLFSDCLTVCVCVHFLNVPVY